jgi:hypothetical protein
VLTRHAVERGLRFDLDPIDFEKIILEGKRVAEGRSKARYTLRTRKGLLIAVCQESPEMIVIITVTRGR